MDFNEIDWLDAQGTQEAHAVRDELTRLRAEAKLPGKCARAIAPLLEDIAAERAVLERERLVSDKLEKALEGIMFCAPENSTIEMRALDALVEVAAIRAARK